jgi:hypothetical protein
MKNGPGRVDGDPDPGAGTLTNLAAAGQEERLDIRPANPSPGGAGENGLQSLAVPTIHDYDINS